MTKHKISCAKCGKDVSVNYPKAITKTWCKACLNKTPKGKRFILRKK